MISPLVAGCGTMGLPRPSAYGGRPQTLAAPSGLAPGRGCSVGTAGVYGWRRGGLAGELLEELELAAEELELARAGTVETPLSPGPAGVGLAFYRGRRVLAGCTALGSRYRGDIELAAGKGAP